MYRLGWLCAGLLICVLFGCPTPPATLLLILEAESGLPEPDELRLHVYDDSGAVVSNRLLPDYTRAFPSEVSLELPDVRGMARVLVQAYKDDGVVGEGATKVTLRAGEEVPAKVEIGLGTLPDRDRDGVPDVIDSCPDLPNPEQGPCDSGDGGADDGPRVDSALPDIEPSCPCLQGCDPGTFICKEVMPSNGYNASGYMQVGAINGALSIDTTTCLASAPSGAPGWKDLAGELQIDASSAVEACVYAVERLVIYPNATLSANGKRPLVFIVKHLVRVDGVLDVGGHGKTPGPGGGAGGVPAADSKGTKGAGPGGGEVCGCQTSAEDDCGGGGGGHGTKGAAGGLEGGSCATKSAGGTAYGSAELVPLSAGSGGASANQLVNLAVGGSGGGGGGALQITCQETIEVNGAVSAGGGGGLIGPTASDVVAGGGGGSGGGILLEAVSISGTGVVAANGGGGAGGNGDKCCSPACTSNGTNGEDGGPSLKVAQGGTPAGSSCSKGGAGGIGNAKPIDGSTGGGGGGGGGAVGRIRFNWFSHVQNPSVQVSGEVSTGEITLK